MKALGLVLALLPLVGWAADARHRGRFYYGPEAQVFEPCGVVKSYWVKGDDKTLQPLRARSEQLREQRGKAYLPVYVEILGSIDTKSPREGFAEDYDGLLHLRKVLKVSTAIPKKCRE